MIVTLIISVLKTVYTMCLSIAMLVMVSAWNYDVTRLLLVTIIARYRLLAKKISRLIGKTVNCPSLHTIL